MAIAKPKRGRVTRRQARTSTRLFAIVSRIVIWYTIATVVFRCPQSANELVDTSPRICHPYIAARSRLAPYLKPHYDTYAAPYVNTVRPYFDSLHGKVYLPTSEFAIDSYSKYAAPRVAQARAYGQQEWRRLAVPQIENLRGKAGETYQEYLEPYVTQVNAVVSPPIGTAKAVALHQYRHLLVPTYRKTVPYARYAYAHGREFFFDVGVPYSIWAYDGVVTFVSRRVWPPVRIVYGRNVEPQLSKIRERLSSYRDSKKIEAVVEAEDASFTSRTEQVESTHSTTSATTVTPDISTEETLSTTSEIPTDTSATPDPKPSVEEDGAKLTDELRRWQVKFSKASDRGLEDLSTRVADVTTRQIETQVEGLGKALITRLEETSSQELGKLKSIIVKEVQKLPVESTEDDINNAYLSILASIRSSGATIKDEAQKLRMWKVKYKEKTESLVQAALDSTMDVIDNIRNLGLQQIGMRWASLESVAYEDWAEYHKLKGSFDGWHVKVKSVAMDHEGLAKARQSAEEVEDEGMGIAQDAAAELARLKDVARWKLHAQDSSDDFSSRRLTAAAAKMGEFIKDKVANAISSVESLTSTQGTVESVASRASEGIANAASSASSLVAEPLSKTRPTPVKDGEEPDFYDEEDDDEEEEEEKEIDPATAEKIRLKKERSQQTADRIAAALKEMIAKRKAAAANADDTSSHGEDASPQGLMQEVQSALGGESNIIAADVIEPDDKDLKSEGRETASPVTPSESVESETADIAEPTPAAFENFETDGDDEIVLTDSATSVSDKLSTQISQASEKASMVSKKYQPAVSSEHDKASSTVADTVSSIYDKAWEFAEDFASDAESVYARASSAVSDAVSGASEGESTLADEFEAGAESAYAKASSAVTKAMNDASEEEATLADEFETGAESMYDSASSFVTDAISEASEEASLAAEDYESSAASAYGKATSTAIDAISAGSAAATSATGEHQPSIESAYTQVSATVARAATAASEDVVDKASSISKSIQSQASDAGSEFSTFTQTVQRV